MTLHVINTGAAAHNLLLNVAGVRTPVLEAGEAYKVTVNLPAGTYTMVCEVPGHGIAGMTGLLHVVD